MYSEVGGKSTGHHKDLENSISRMRGVHYCVSDCSICPGYWLVMTVISTISLSRTCKPNGSGLEDKRRVEEVKTGKIDWRFHNDKMQELGCR